jgi:S1-C subfamily serine protease
MEFGNVQRGILGVEGGELNSSASKELGVKETEGFYIKRVNKNSGAEKSGLIKGDIIIQLDAQKISSYAELNGYISTKRPNDKVQVTFIRNEKTITVTVILSKSDVFSTQFKGLDLENINATDKKKFRIDYGVKIKDVNNERLNAYANDLKGGIILSIGNIKAIDVESVSKALSNLNENQSIQIEMLTVNGQVIRLIL